MIRTELRDIRKVLLATGVSSESVGPALAARRFATLFNAALHVVHVVEPVHDPDEKALPGLADAHSRAAREELGRFAASHALDRDCTLHVPRGRTIDEISRLGVSLGADLLIIGRYGKGGLKRGALGSNADALARHFPASILIVPPEYRGSFSRVGAATDFSDDAWLAVRRAADLNARLARLAEVPTLHAFAVPSGYQHLGSWEDACKRVDAQRRAEAADLSRRVERELPGSKLTLLIREGAPPRTLPKLAAEAKLDLLVITTHGRTRPEAALLGRTAESVIRNAPCAVWVEKSAANVHALAHSLSQLLR